jgi:hypothetical protein
VTQSPTHQSERSIQNAILRAYATRADMRIWRQNTGAATFGGQTVRFGIPGQADLTGLLSDGRRLEIEVKSPIGRQSPEQQQYQRIIERFGGVYILARSVADVADGLRRAGYEIE